MNFKYATQSFQIRAEQRDEIQLSQFYEVNRNLCNYFLGQKYTNNLGNLLKTSTDFLYYFLSIGLNDQTLGEEDCDIIQIDETTKLPPKFLVKFKFKRGRKDYN
jgi:peroxin-10